MLGCPWAHREINIQGHVFGPNHVSLAEHHTESMKCHNLFIINMLYFCVSGEDLRYPMEATLQRSNDSNALTSLYGCGPMEAMTAAPGISSETFAQRRALENQQDGTSSLGNIPGSGNLLTVSCLVMDLNYSRMY